MNDGSIGASEYSWIMSFFWHQGEKRRLEKCLGVSQDSHSMMRCYFTVAKSENTSLVSVRIDQTQYCTFISTYIDHVIYRSFHHTFALFHPFCVTGWPSCFCSKEEHIEWHRKKLCDVKSSIINLNEFIWWYFFFFCFCFSQSICLLEFGFHWVFNLVFFLTVLRSMVDVLWFFWMYMNKKRFVVVVAACFVQGFLKKLWLGDFCDRTGFPLSWLVFLPYHMYFQAFSVLATTKRLLGGFAP